MTQFSSIIYCIQFRFLLLIVMYYNILKRYQNHYVKLFQIY